MNSAQGSENLFIREETEWVEIAADGAGKERGIYERC